MRALEFVTESRHPSLQKQRIDEAAWIPAIVGGLGAAWGIIKMVLAVYTIVELVAIAYRTNLLSGTLGAVDRATGAVPGYWEGEVIESLTLDERITLLFIAAGFGAGAAKAMVKGLPTWFKNNIGGLFSRKLRQEKFIAIMQSGKSIKGKKVMDMTSGELAWGLTLAGGKIGGSVTAAWFLGAWALYESGSAIADLKNVVVANLPTISRITGHPMKTFEDFVEAWNMMEIRSRVVILAALWAIVLGISLGGRKLVQWALRHKDDKWIKAANEEIEKLTKSTKSKTPVQRKEPGFSADDGIDIDLKTPKPNVVRKKPNRIKMESNLNKADGNMVPDNLKIFDATQGKGNLKHVDTGLEAGSMDKLIKKIDDLVNQVKKSNATTPKPKKVDVKPNKTELDFKNNPQDVVNKVSRETGVKPPQKSMLLGPKGETLYVNNKGQIVDQAGRVLKGYEKNVAK